MKVFLKKDKERALLMNRHPWIFSGAVERFPDGLSSGDIAHVYSSKGEFLATAYFHTSNSLSGRVLSFSQEPVEKILKDRIERAWKMRHLWIDTNQTNCFRWINSEEDGLPGLIVDFYNGVLVVQVHTCGMEKLKPLVIDFLVDCAQPCSIYEKSNSSARLQEGLLPYEGHLLGENIEECEVLEYGIRLLVSIVEGQKTGLFLDQREMRKKVRELSKGRRVLNCFSYTGGFSLSALCGGAQHVTSVDICSKACHRNEKNTRLNGFSEENHTVLCEDVFHFFDKNALSSYEIILLDPPAFAKKRQDIPSASKGYRELNAQVFERCAPNTLVLTASCSYFIDRDLFQQLIFQAASTVGRNVQILSRHIQALDHPISLFHPEGDYLKSLLLFVE